jgi:hypothetical protein
VSDVGAACPLVDVKQRLVAEIIKKLRKPGGCLSGPCVLWHNIVSINGNYVCDFDGAGISVAEPWCAVSGDLILSKDLLSLFNFAFAETSAALGRPIPDDVDGAADEFSFPIAPS